MRPHGRARVSTKSPQAFAICDKCGFLFNHVDLRWQLEWAGNKLINLKQLVCRRCNDIPNNQLRAIIVPADPIPIMNPRIQDYVSASTDYITTSGSNTVDPITGIPVPGGDNILTQNDNNVVTQQTGEPPGGLNQEPGVIPVNPSAPGNDDPGLPYDNDEIPNTGPLT